MRLPTLLVSVLLVAPAAEAQLAAVRLGARVRIEAMDVDTGRIVGTVVLRSGDVVTIRGANRELLTFPASRIASLDVSSGKTRASGARTGAIIGTGWGTAVGLLTIGAAHTCTGPRDARTCTPAQPPDIAKWVGLWTASSALLGASVGAILGGERWERLGVGGRATMRLQERGAGLTVAFR